MDIGKAKQEGKAEMETLMAEERLITANMHKLNAQKAADEATDKLNQVINDCEAKLTSQKNYYEAAMSRAVSTATNDAKATLNREWEDKLKSMTEDIINNATSTWQGKVESEKMRLELFKKDVNTQIQRVADERSILQQRVDYCEQAMKKMETTRDAENRQMVENFEKEQDRLTRAMTKEKKEALEEMSKQQSDAIVGIEAKFKAIADERIAQEKEFLTNEMEEHMKQLQADSEKLISSLEVAMGDLRKERNKLSEELDSTANKLENTEDSLYDAQQQIKKKEKENSMNMWKMLAGVEKLKINFKKGLKRSWQIMYSYISTQQQKMESRKGFEMHWSNTT